VTGMSETDVLLADEAESAVLGSLLIDPTLIASLGSLTASDFYRPANATIFKAVRKAVETGGRVDALVILEVLRADGDLQRVGGAPYLHTLQASVPTVANASFYARVVSRAATRRTLLEQATKLRQVCLSPDLDDALEMAAQISVSVGAIADETPGQSGDFLHDLYELGAFASSDVAPHNWVIPGLLEHMDRVIVVASEGAGKSTWMRSVATMLGQGIHPLNPMLRIPPKRTLIVDLENPTSLIRRASRRLVSVAEASGGWTSDQVWLWSRPGGVNIRKAADAALLDRLIGHVRPALLCLGPLYKASLGGSDRGEQVAAETTAALDRIRERHGCAMWLEHHAPMAQNGTRTLRPIDSGLWSRWPEFGITLERDGENHPNQFRLGRFRRDREQRCWPDTLAWGPEWPFEFGWDQGMPGALHDGRWSAA